MRLPNPPHPQRVEAISPTVYEAALKCRARAVWSLSGDCDGLPQHPSSVLGRSFHSVMAAANRGELGSSREDRRAAARELFRTTARTAYAGCHPHLRAKFKCADELPFFNLTCEQAALNAAAVTSNRSVSTDASFGSGSNVRTRRKEVRLASANGRIVGRLDHINQTAQAVLDYKTGRGGGTSLLDHERRQLRLYTYLAIQNGVNVIRGIVVRSNGLSVEERISESQAFAEAENALNVLEELNSAIEARAEFKDLASPAPNNCCDCPCIPFCSAFWDAARPEWKDGVGCQVEGRVESVQPMLVRGVRLIALAMQITRGTELTVRANVQAFPERWLTADGGPVPSRGDSIRIVNARTGGESAPLTVHVDRLGTTVWTVGT